MKILFGIVVDEELFKEYEKKTYRIDGTPYDLVMIENLATSKNYARTPELQEEAKKIKEEIQKEIKAYYAKENEKKNPVSVRHQDFVGYLEDLKGIRKTAAEMRIALRNNLERIESEWKRAAKDKNAPEYDVLKLKAEYLENVQANKKKLVELYDSTKQEIHLVKVEFHKHLSDFYCANGARMDDDTVRLLNSGVLLTPNEIDNLVIQNLNNPTMLRLINSYCTKHKMKNHSAAMYGRVAKESGEAEKEVFDNISGYVLRAVSVDPRDVAIWADTDEYFDRYYNTAVEEMENMLIKPKAVDVKQGE